MTDTPAWDAIIVGGGIASLSAANATAAQSINRELFEENLATHSLPGFRPGQSRTQREATAREGVLAQESNP